jgi:hypothetical protein
MSQATPTSTEPRLAWLAGWPGALIVLAVSYALAYSAATRKCNTYDELAHLAGGYSYWMWNDYRFEPENGNWPQRWGAIPLLTKDYAFLPPERVAWADSDPWYAGKAFLFDLGNDADDILRRSRAIMALLLPGVGCLVFAMSRYLFGLGPAWISLLAWSFCPLALAHGPLVTSDLMATFFFLGAVWWLWRTWHEVTIANLLVGAFFSAGVFLSKFSAPLFVVMAAVLFLIRMFADRPLAWRIGVSRTLTTRREQIAVMATVLLAQGLLVWLCIWASYGFRYEIRANGAPPIRSFQKRGTWESVLPLIGAKGNVIGVMRDHRLLPEAYLAGMTFVLAHSETRNAYFRGETSDRGWIWYFPLAFAIKTPLSFFGLLVLAFLHGRRTENWRPFLYESAPLWVLGGVYWLVALASSLNIGVRHLLPTVPVMCILAGPAWIWAVGALGRRIVLGGLLVVYMVAVVWAWPNYLTYFNVVIGGPSQGYKWLVDSSLDWGQDLPAMKRWLDDHTAERPVYLSFFGTASPKYYGIGAEWLPGHVDWDFDAERLTGPHELRPGVYCISATMRAAVYLDTVWGNWTAAYESLYLDDCDFVARWRKASAADRKEMLEDRKRALGLRVDTDVWYLYEVHRFGRLLAYLRRKTPDDEVGHSILIYRVTQPDLDAALEGPRPGS